MRLLGSAALAAAAIVTSIVAVPATAAGPGYQATASSNCGNGVETVTLHQEQVTEDMTHVVITGTDVRNGRWTGAYNPEIESGSLEEQVELKFPVHDHSFKIELDVPGDADRFPGVYLNRRDTTCTIEYSHAAHSFTAAGFQNSLITRFPDTNEVVARAILFGCEDGTRWRWTVWVTFALGEEGAGGNGRICHNGVVKLPKTVVTSEGPPQEHPDAVRLIARNSAGDVRRISWAMPSVV